MPGHGDALFTLRTYARGANRQQAEAADRLGSPAAGSLQRRLRRDQAAHPIIPCFDKHFLPIALANMHKRFENAGK